MKITESRLRQVIREEVRRSLSERKVTHDDFVEFARKAIVPISPGVLADALEQSGELEKFLPKLRAQYIDRDPRAGGGLTLGLRPVSGGYDEFSLIELPREVQSLDAVEVLEQDLERSFPDGAGFITDRTLVQMNDGERIKRQIKNIKAAWLKRVDEIDPSM